MAGWIKGIIHDSRLLSFQKLGLIDKLLLEHAGLPHVLDHAVNLVNFFGWMSQGGHSEPLLLLALCYQSSLCFQVFIFVCSLDIGLKIFTENYSLSLNAHVI